MRLRHNVWRFSDRPFAMSFPVLFTMNFGGHMLVYELVGSASFPTAECLQIPLMRNQIHGIAMRQAEGLDWLWLSYQHLHGIVPLPGWHPAMHFRWRPTGYVIILA